MTEPDADAAPDVPSYVVDLYKLAVEMADRVSARRATANNFFLTLHTGLAAFVGIITSARVVRGGANASLDKFGLLLTAASGGVLAVTWWVLLRSYRDLNNAKFKAIGELEDRLGLRPFAREWQELMKDPVKKWRPRYAELSFVERVVPVVFLAIYIALAVRVLYM